MSKPKVKYYMIYQKDYSTNKVEAYSLWAVRSDGMERVIWYVYGTKADDVGNEEALKDWDWHIPDRGGTIEDSIKLYKKDFNETGEYIREASEREAFMYGL